MGEKIVRFYDETKNPDRGFFPGVPLRDLTEDEYEAQPDWLKRSIDAHDMYRKTPLKADKPTPAAKPKATPRSKAKAPAESGTSAAQPEAAPEQPDTAEAGQPTADGGGN